MQLRKFDVFTHWFWSAPTLQKFPTRRAKNPGVGQQGKVCSTLSLLGVSLGCFRMYLTVFPLVNQNIYKVACCCTVVFQATVEHKKNSKTQERDWKGWQQTTRNRHFHNRKQRDRLEQQTEAMGRNQQMAASDHGTHQASFIATLGVEHPHEGPREKRLKTDQKTTNTTKNDQKTTKNDQKETKRPKIEQKSTWRPKSEPPNFHGTNTRKFEEIISSPNKVSGPTVCKIVSKLSPFKTCKGERVV